MAKTVRISDRVIGGDQPAFIIAEAGSNHNGDLGMAKDLALAALAAGCDCVKFQTYTAEEFCADRSKTFTYRSQGKSVTESEFEMFKRLEFSRDEWIELMAYCDEIGILFLTTVQDRPNLDMMLELGLKGIKVGSDDFDHLVNIRHFAGTGLPMILSKGMADLGEIDRIVNAIGALTTDLIVLHCVSLYPTEPRFLNIGQISTLQKIYPNVVWGFSDHSIGPLASILAVSLGAKVIEKHFTLDHDLPGPDHWFSLDPTQMREMAHGIRFAEEAIGDGRVLVTEDELATKNIMRRKVVASSDLLAGDVLSEQNVAFKRATNGAPLSEWEQLSGEKLVRPVRANEGITFSDIDFST
jgi:N,N'-diacetyllegionaminate synthase